MNLDADMTWPPLLRFLQEMRRKTRSVYRIKCEELNRVQRVLDMVVACIGSSIYTEPFLKEVSRPYLGHDSCHDPKVHKSWPIANILRLRSISTLNFSFIKARDRLLMRYAAENIDERAVHRSANLPFSTSLPLELSIGGKVITLPPSVAPQKLWGTLRFHGCLIVNKFNAILASETTRWSRYAVSALPILGIAFKSADRNISTRLTAVRV